MKSTKKRNIGVGSSLYGIPINDILTPDQLNDIRKDASDMQIRKRRRKRKKQSLKKRRFFKIQFSDIRFNKNIIYAVCAAVVILMLVLIFKKPVIMRIFSKSYVAGAMSDTLKNVSKEIRKSSENLFGFNVVDEKEVTLSLNGTITKDSQNHLNDMSSVFQGGYSQKDKRVTFRSQNFQNGTEVLSINGYINDEEVGINIPQIFGEYWVAPAKNFGKKWNDSGLRKMIYANEVDEGTDLSFSSVFNDKQSVFGKDGKKIRKLTEKLLKKGSIKYAGKSTVLLSEKNKSADLFDVAFSDEDIRQYLTDIASLVGADAELSKLFLMSENSNQTNCDPDEVFKKIIRDNSVRNVTAKIATYNGFVKMLDVDAEYEDNNKIAHIDFIISSSSAENVCDVISADVNVSGGEKDFSYSLSTSGDHVSDSKKFTDKTTVSIKSQDYSCSFESDMIFDFKKESASGTVKIIRSGNTDIFSYSGKCSKKGEFKLSLSQADLSMSGDLKRNISGKLDIELAPDMKILNLNTSNKKMILDYSKSEAENYVSRLAKSDSVKKLNNWYNSAFDY